MDELSRFTKEVFLDEHDITISVNLDVEDWGEFLSALWKFLEEKEVGYEICKEVSIPGKNDVYLKVIGHDYISLWALINKGTGDLTVSGKGNITPTDGNIAKDIIGLIIKACRIYWSKEFGIFRFEGYWTITT